MQLKMSIILDLILVLRLPITFFPFFWQYMFENSINQLLSFIGYIILG